MTRVNKKEIQNFVEAWSNQGHEVADKVTYWNTILRFLGVPQEQIDNHSFIDYEKPIKLKQNEHFNGSIDAYIPSTHVLIEQKSSGVDLSKPETRPNGGHTEKITPFEQARRYDYHLSANERAYYYVLCNFDQIIIYDIRENVDTKPVVINLKDLANDLYLLDFLVKKDETKRIQKEQKISVAAGGLVSKIYDELAKIFDNYKQLDDDKVKHSINSLCVRLVFCLYAEDAELFGPKEDEVFYNYLKDVEPNQIGLKLKELFKVLNTKIEDRNKVDAFWTAEHPKLAKFPYVNGGLFAEEDIFIPPFTQELKDIVLNDASKGFNWSDISPTVFGAVFESTLNPDTRRQGGMHYTSVENIHKVIDPLFLDDLKQELEDIKEKYKNPKTIKTKAIEFQRKLSQLTFFDPACGSGNFLTETFLSLRRLENEAIRLELGGESVLDVGQADDWIKVSIKQFYGIEINDFAVSVAKTAMWIAEDQMMKETQDLLYAPDWDFLPLKTYVNIHEGNALQMDWNSVLPNYACHYVMGNPPFVGTRNESKEQKNDIKELSKALKNVDYVAGWYYKATKYMKGTQIRTGFVSTNSITEGVQVPLLWKILLEDKIIINFAYRTFVWDNDTKNKAHVHCVIIGFSHINNTNKFIVNEEGEVHHVTSISPYLLPTNNLLVSPRKKPFYSQIPLTVLGNMSKDGGYLTLKPSEKDELIAKEPLSEKYIRQYCGSSELLNNRKRYCLWLKDCSPNDLQKMPLVIDRIKKVREMRLNSKKKATQEWAEYPTLFVEDRQPDTGYLQIPITSSKRRKYIPMKFQDKDVIANLTLLIPNCSLYIFGLLESSVHNDWMRTVAGRMKSDYRYSSQLVYNTFPWPISTDKQRKRIEETAQAILDARANHHDSSLATLYNPVTMPADLRKAHKANDKAVLQAYGLPTDSSDSDIVAHLFKMYEKLTK